MAKSDTQKSNSTLFLAVIVILALAIIGLWYFYSSSSSQAQSAYNNLNSNYTSLKSQSQSQISTLQTQLTENKTLYQNAENNLTNPYSEILYDQKTINLPRYNESNYTYNSTLGIYYYAVTWGRFNFSFNAPYPGYIVFNGTSTVINNPNPASCGWEVYVSDKTPHSRNVSSTFNGNNSGYTYKYAYTYQGIDELFINLTNTPFVELCPVQSITYLIPVNKGTNYVFIDSANDTGQTVTFSAKYMGFHTS